MAAFRQVARSAFGSSTQRANSACVKTVNFTVLDPHLIVHSQFSDGLKD